MKKILIVLRLLFSTVVYAEHEEFSNEVYMQQVPALCGTVNAIQTYVDHYKFKPYHLTLGRTGMVEDGEPVYMITYMVNEDNTQSIAVLDIPSGLERCILFHTFDLVVPQKN